MIRPTRTSYCGCCWYQIDGLGREGECPECGLRFDLADPESFVSNIPFLLWPHWLPTIALCTVGGLLVIIPFLSYGFTSAGLWFGVPMALGAIVGVSGKHSAAARAFVACAIVTSLVLALFSMNFAGLFCGLILFGMFLVPIMTGVVIGACLRLMMQAKVKHREFTRASRFRSLMFLLVPMVWMLIEGPSAGKNGIETVVTSERVMISRTDVWDSLIFYEEVKHRPPLLLRMGLPIPVSTDGAMNSVGDVKVCEYRKGKLRKRIIEVRPGERLAFSVIHQEIGFEKSVRLVDGSFDLIAEGSDETLLRLTTSYEPLLTPRWVWRPIEKLSTRTLHRHVIEGIRLESEAKSADAMPIALAARR